nr:retrovirus-related Pol polyprotein from transposon TNT 1-94 [Tanacetum cinerariifolium]
MEAIVIELVAVIEVELAEVGLVVVGLVVVSDDLDDDDDDQDDDDPDEDDQDEGNDDDQDTDNEGNEFVHPKLSNHEEEETKDEESFDPIVQTPKNSNDEGNDDASLGLNISSEEGQDVEDNEDELYRDVNINLEGRDVQMTDFHTTQEFEDTHVTLTPVNPDGQQQSSNSKAYNEYYAVASGAAPPKTKTSVRMTKINFDATVTPPTAVGTRLLTFIKGKQPAKASKAKSLTVLSEVTMTEAEQIKLATKRSRQQTHISQASGSGVDEGTEDDDDQDDDDQDDNDDDQDTDNDGDDFVHPKLSIHEEETKDEESFDPIVQTPENADDDGNDDASLGLNVGGEEGQDAEDDDEEMYRDVNINLEGRDQAPTPPTTTPSTFLQDLLNFGLLFGFDHRLKTLKANFSKFVQTNQFAGAISSIPGIVERYMDQRMNEAVKVAVQIQSDRLQDEAQAKNEEFLKNLDENIQKIIKEQVKEQVKVQVSKILPKIEKTMNEQLEAKVLTQSSNSSKTSYVMVADLSEMELNKILIKEMESNKSIHRSDEQRNLYKALVDAYESDKIILDTYEDTVTLKRRRDYEDKDEEPSAGSDRGDDDKLYKFKEGDFKRLRIQDIEDMLLPLAQGKLANLTVEERFAFNVSLRMFTRSIVIQRRMEDLQLGVKSYQKKLNLTKPDTYQSDLKRKEAYTAYSNPRGFIYQNKDKQNRLMQIDELHKFSDGTLNDVRTALDDRLKDGKPLTCSECEGMLRGGFCLPCNLKAKNSFICYQNAYSFNDISNNSNYLPQPQYENYLCNLCGNNSHDGYDCQQQFPPVYEQEPSYNQNYNDNYYSHNSPSFLCCDKCGESHETFQCQPMDQNIDFSGSDQIQTLQYPDVHPPYQEIRDEVFHAKGDLMKSIQTFLEEFNCIPFEEKPKILLQAWYKFFSIQHAQPEDSNELFQKLLEDLKELAEYVNSPSRDHLIFFDDNEDHSVQNKEYLENHSNEIAASNSDQKKEKPPQDSDIRQLIREECCIEVCEEQKQKMENTILELVEIFAPILSTKVPEYSPSMGYEHPNTTPKIESDEIIKSGVEELVPILSENKERLINITKNDLFLALDNSIPPGIENFAYDSKGDIRFLEALLINDSIPFPVNESSEFDFDNPSFPRPPSKPPDADFEPDSKEEILVMMNDNDDLECLNPRDEFENDDYFPFMFVIRIFMPYLICSKVFSFLLSTESEDTIFDPEIPSGEIKVHIEVLSVLWGNRLPIWTVRCRCLVVEVGKTLEQCRVTVAWRERFSCVSYKFKFGFLARLVPQDDSWIVAMQEELNQFIANDVWELVQQPRNMTIIETKGVFRNKLDENDIVLRNKARLVDQGYNQQEGIDYDESYAPVARLESIRILLAYACALDFKLFQMVVKSAFLNGFINEEYKYIKEMLKKFGLEESKPVKTPMSSDTKLAKDEEYESADSTKYRGMIGSLLYLMASRPDIMFSVCLCARFQEAPKTSHLEVVKHIFRYIKGITHLRLWYPKGTGIETVVYADSDHAGDYVDRKSTSGIYTFVGCCLTSWFSKKQMALAISTTEAKYVSVRKAYQQALWMKQTLIDYDVRLDDVLIMCNNKGAIDLSKNPVQHSRTKHIKIRHHFLRDNSRKDISRSKICRPSTISSTFLRNPLNVNHLIIFVLV